MIVESGSTSDFEATGSEREGTAVSDPFIALKNKSLHWREGLEGRVENSESKESMRHFCRFSLRGLSSYHGCPNSTIDLSTEMAETVRICEKP